MGLRIGVNALYLIPGGVGGTEIYLRFLLQSLARIDSVNEYVVFANRETAGGLTPISPQFSTVLCGVSARFRPGRILFEQIQLPHLLRANRIDVLLNPGFTAPIFAPCPQVTVFHDLQHKIHPEFFRRLDLPFWNVLLAASAARSQRLIAVSDQTARDLGAHYPATSKKISVIAHGVDPEFFTIGAQRSQCMEEMVRPFVLTVSTLHPHKNLDRLIEAFGRFRERHPSYRLVVAGLKGFATTALQERIHALGLEEHVECPGWIPREDLYSLFRSASAYIAPSLFEGFGMPLTEALAAGIPTACSDIPIFREVAGKFGDAACSFDPASTDAMTAALETIVFDAGFRNRAATAGPLRARSFNWDKAAAQTIRELVAASQLY